MTNNNPTRRNNSVKKGNKRKGLSPFQKFCRRLWKKAKRALAFVFGSGFACFVFSTMLLQSFGIEKEALRPLLNPINFTLIYLFFISCIILFLALEGFYIGGGDK